MMSFSCIGCVQKPALKSSVCLKNRMVFANPNRGVIPWRKWRKWRKAWRWQKERRHISEAKQGCKRSLLLRPNLRKVLPHFEVEMKSEAAFENGQRNLVLNLKPISVASSQRNCVFLHFSKEVNITMSPPKHISELNQFSIHHCLFVWQLKLLLRGVSTKGSGRGIRGVMTRTPQAQTSPRRKELQDPSAAWHMQQKLSHPRCGFELVYCGVLLMIVGWGLINGW